MTEATPLSASPTTVRPTASAGAILAIILGALPAAGLGLDVAWVVVAAGTSVLALAPWMARRQVVAVQEIARDTRIAVSDGRTSMTPIRVRTGRAARNLLIALRAPSAKRVDQDRAPRIALLAAEPGQDTAFACPLRIGRRGRHAGLVAHLESSFPFGLFVATRDVSLPGPVTVYPRVFERRDRRLDPWLHALALGIDEPRRGRPAARSPGLPMTVRSARAGDTARDLAWRHSARRVRWLAFDRAPTTRARIEVRLVCAVHGGSPDGMRAYGAEAGSRWGAGRRELAFEWAVRTAATMVLQLLRTGHDVTTSVAGSDGNEGLVVALSRAPRTSVSSQRPEAHLELLTDVSLAHAGGLEPGTDRAPAPGASRGARRGTGRRAEKLTLTVVPIIRTAPSVDSETDVRRMGRATATAPVIGVDAVGRLSAIRIGVPPRRSVARRPPAAPAPVTGAPAGGAQ